MEEEEAEKVEAVAEEMVEVEALEEVDVVTEEEVKEEYWAEDLVREDDLD